MKNPQILLVLTVSLSLVVFAAGTLNAQPARAALDEARKLEIDRVFAHFNNDTPGATLAVVANGEIIYEQCYGMSNLEYDIPMTPSSMLAEIVERLTGKSPREFADEHIFKPLGMKNTHFIDNHLGIIKNRTYAYAPKSGEGYSISIPVCDTYGPASLFTTVGDLALWIDNFAHKRVGGEEGVKMLLTRGKLNNGEEWDFALGVVHTTYKGLKTVASCGHHAGYRAEFIMYPEHGTSIITFSNVSDANLRDGDPEGLLYQVADIVFADYIVEPEQQARRKTQRERSHTPEPAVLTEELSREYEGTYYSEELDASQNIVFADTTLVLQPKKRDEVPLKIKDIDTFSFGSNIVNFLCNEENRVIAFTITTPTVRNVGFDKRQ